MSSSNKSRETLLIGIVGKGNAGKTTTANILSGKFTEVVFAEPVKRITEIVYGFEYDMLLGDTPEKRTLRKTLKDPIWNKTPVEAMQYIGTDLFRDCFDNYVWIKIAQRKIDILRNAGKNVIITDCRFPNEIEFIRSQGGVILVIYENEEDLKPSSDTTLHASENSFQTAIKASDFYYQNKKEGLDKMRNDIWILVEKMIHG